jgi:ABC-type uncharacterized transport system substrate-binding protein
MEEATGAPSSLADYGPKRLRASGRDGAGLVSQDPSALSMLFSRHTRRREFITLLGGAVATWQTSTIPIVFLSVGDPIAMGLVESLPHPGRNATGFSDILADSETRRAKSRAL